MSRLKWGGDRESRPWRGFDRLAIPLALFLLTILTRLPFRSQYLYHWDSVNFALAIEDFDLRSEQPHPPGYILYVWLCRWVNRLLDDPQQTMVALSFLGSALAVVALYFLGRAMFSRRVGLGAAAFLMSSPLFWFYGEIALPHALDAFLVVLCAWLAFRIHRGEIHLWPLATVVLGIAGGIRPQTLVFLGPLLAFSLRKAGGKRFLAAVALGGLTCLLWFLPLIETAGGLKEYMAVLSKFGLRYQRTTSVFLGAGAWGLNRNLRKLLMYTLYGWGVPAAFILPILAERFRSGRWLISREKSLFLIIWAAPAVLFYALIHMGQQGLVFVFLPALMILSAVGLEFLLSVRKPWAMVSMVLVLAANVAIYLLAPEYPLGDERLRIINREALARTDRYYGERFDAIRLDFPSESTAIVASSWRHVEYYLPEYVVLHFDVGGKWEIDKGEAKVTPQTILSALPADLGLRVGSNQTGALAVFDETLEGFNRSIDQVVTLPLPGGGAIDYLRIRTGDQIFIDQTGFGIKGHNSYEPLDGCEETR